jgi:hypothetical protein
MPDDATPDMRRIAEDIRLLLGLSGSAGEWRAMPYACTWAAERMGWGRQAFRRANDAIRALERAGVIRCANRCSQREKTKSPTKCYLPPLAGGVREPESRPEEVVENDSIAVERTRGGASKPAVELADQVTMDGAEPVAEDVRVVATGDDARDTIGHAEDDNGAIGRQRSLPVDRVVAPDNPDPAWLDELHRRCGGGA